jgi:TolB-like protein/Tfp pilus assembly protein PilF
MSDLREKAVFLSYASQDAAAARRICEALRASGVEVWFDQSELRGGDAWDQKIRRQIHDCSLFIPVISVHTDERSEGYFRLEWKLAVDRSHLMADDAPFLFPVVIDDTNDADARVPDKFRSVQWTRLPGGEGPAAFCQRVTALLSGTAGPAHAAASRAGSPRRTAVPWPAIAIVLALAVAVVGWLSWQLVRRMPAAAPATAPPAGAQASVIPEHSIAVLPFVNVGDRKDQEFFSDGLSETLLNLLSKVPGLQVAARTSAFSFKGKAVDVPTIGRQLLVAHVLEGSVYRVGTHLRVTAQLERADNGYQIWTETYDRQLGDVFRIQDDIASAVVKALKVSLLGNSVPQGIGTRNSDAYLVFLQGRAKMESDRLADYRAAATDFERALKLDPSYSPAYVELASAKLQLAEFDVTDGRMASFEAATNEARVLLERALAQDGNNAQAYIERGYLRAFNDLPGAEQDYRRGIELNPNSARGYAGLAAVLFEFPARRGEALEMIARAHQLDPLEPKYEVLKAQYLEWGTPNLREAETVLESVVARYPTYQPGLMRLSDMRRTDGRYADAILYDEQALKLDPLSEWTRRMLMFAYAEIGETEAVRQLADEAPHHLPIHRLDLLAQQGNWRQAAEVAYAAFEDGTMDAASEPMAVFALRMDAHSTHDYRRALSVFEQICGVTWSAAGVPVLPSQMGFAYASVAAGDMLLGSGDRTRGERLLRASLADIEHVTRDFKRSETWYAIDRATALALLGDRKQALAALHRAVEAGYIVTWSQMPLDPAFDFLRADPEFQGLMRDIQQKAAHERQLLAEMRSAGRVPDRSRHPS